MRRSSSCHCGTKNATISGCSVDSPHSFSYIGRGAFGAVYSSDVVPPIMGNNSKVAWKKFTILTVAELAELQAMPEDVDGGGPWTTWTFSYTSSVEMSVIFSFYFKRGATLQPRRTPRRRRRARFLPRTQQTYRVSARCPNRTPSPLPFPRALIPTTKIQIK